MIDFITAVKNIMNEKGKEVSCLFTDGIISKNTFYKYKQRNPSLQTLIKISNYLNVSIDYLFELSDVNDYQEYSIDQSKFYEKLCGMINNSHISNRQFCKEMNYQKDNIKRYENGVEPSVRTLFEIVNYFGCSFDDLLTRKNEIN